MVKLGFVFQVAVRNHDGLMRLLILEQAKHGIIVFGQWWRGISWEPLPQLVQVDEFRVDQDPLRGFECYQNGVRLRSPYLSHPIAHIETELNQPFIVKVVDMIDLLETEDRGLT